MYKIELKVEEHSFTTSQVLPINATACRGTRSITPGKRVAAGPRYLPPSTIYGFNGTFPGPMINAEYGQPGTGAIHQQAGKRSEKGLDRQDFGSPGPDYSFLTHLHNAHSAPEERRQTALLVVERAVQFRVRRRVGRQSLFELAGGWRKAEKQSFFWFHDHRMDHTGANVYKGLVGLYPIYDPVLYFGDETT